MYKKGNIVKWLGAKVKEMPRGKAEFPIMKGFENYAGSGSSLVIKEMEIETKAKIPNVITEAFIHPDKAILGMRKPVRAYKPEDKIINDKGDDNGKR
jgi:hypothetical protein